MTLIAEFRRRQLTGAVGAAFGLLALVLWFQIAPYVFHAPAIPDADSGGRLAFAARWLIVPGSTLLLGVWAAARRGFLPDAIAGTRTPASHSLEINLRYNQNTVEQVILAAVAWPALAIELPMNRLDLIPAFAMTFLVGRVTFWIGYVIHPMGRTFGMVVTVLPTIGAYLWLGYRSFTSA